MHMLHDMAHSLVDGEELVVARLVLQLHVVEEAAGQHSLDIERGQVHLPTLDERGAGADVVHLEQAEHSYALQWSDMGESKGGVAVTY